MTTGLPDGSAYAPNAAQAKMLAIFRAKQRKIIAHEGGWGMGKTRLIALTAMVAHHDDPGIDGAYVTDSMSRGSRTIALEFSSLLEPLGWTFHAFHKGTPAPHWLSPPHKVTGQRTKVWALSWKRPSTKAKSANSLEGPSLGWMIADECNQYNTDEVAVAMLGRVRSGNPGRIMLLGKPAAGCWWRKFAHARGGHESKASSRINRANLPEFDAWLSTLSAREIAENIDCIPQPNADAVLDNWVAEIAPAGNLTPDDWRPEPWMHTVCAFDFGVRHPSALVISHDPRLCNGEGAFVVWNEAVPSNASVYDVCTILKNGRPDLGVPGVWPAHRNDAPPGTIPVHHCFGDRAGRNRRDDGAMSSAIGDVQSWPHGLGVKVNYTDKPDRVQVLAGIRLLWRLIQNAGGRRSLLCWHKLWYGGTNDLRTFSACVTSYEWASGAKVTPIKGVYDHSIDALRYWAINTQWHDATAPRAARAAFNSANDMRTQRQAHDPTSDR